MIYGLYLSATGILANSHNIDVLSNNLANSESVGFKRDLTLYRQRLTQYQENHHPDDWTDPMLENLGGGLTLNPTLVDSQQGELERTGNALDLGIQGSGYLAVQDGGATRLTRDGRLMVNEKGELALANSRGTKILNAQQRPIHLRMGADTTIATDGTIRQNGQAVDKIGLFEVPDRTLLTKHGEGLFNYPDARQLTSATGMISSEYVERANVDPATELAQLMEAQRQLEANANMIHTQDETLQTLVTNVAKVG